MSIGQHSDVVSALRTVGSQVISASFDGTIKRWPLPPDGGQGVTLAKVDGGEIYDLDLAAGRVAFGGEFQSQAEDNSSFYPVVIVDQSDGGNRQELLLHAEDVVDLVAFSPSGKQLVSSSDNTCAVVDLSNPSRPALWLSHERKINAVAFATGDWVVTAADDGTVRLWDLSTTTPVDSMILLRTTPTTFHLSITPDGNQLIVSGTKDGQIRTWNLPECRMLLRAAKKAREPLRERTEEGHPIET